MAGGSSLLHSGLSVATTCHCLIMVGVDVGKCQQQKSFSSPGLSFRLGQVNGWHSADWKQEDTPFGS